MKSLDTAVSDAEPSTPILVVLELAAQPLKVGSMFVCFAMVVLIIVMVVRRHRKSSATDGPSLPHSSTEPVPRLKECPGQATSSPGF